MRRPVKKAIVRVITKYACISCGASFRVRWTGNPGDTALKLEKAAEEGCPLLLADGWREVEGGWKCGGCTGIRGELAKHLRSLKPGKARVLFGPDGRILWAKNAGRRCPPGRIP